MHAGKNAVEAKIEALSYAASLHEHKRLIHLLKRSLLGLSLSEYQSFQNKPVTAIVDQLLHTCARVLWPVKDYHIEDDKQKDNIPYGETWIYDYNYAPIVNQQRKQSVMRWLVRTLYSQENSIMPKMVLFWHNQFPLQIARNSLANTVFDYYFGLMQHALTDYRLLLLCLVTGGALSEYYKRTRRRSGSLYLLYAERICCHLYGEQYAEYVSKAKLQKYARLLYEWSVVSNQFSLSLSFYEASVASTTLTDFKFITQPAARQCLMALHDFHGKLIHHEKAAAHLSEKLFRFFVHTNIDRLADKRMIRRMMATAMTSFQIRDLLQTLLLNEEFYSPHYIGTMPKSPADFIFEACKLNKPLIIDPTQMTDIPFWDWLLQQAAELGQPFGDIGDEKGWSGYYKSPQQEWLTGAQYFMRKKIIKTISDPDFLSQQGGVAPDRNNLLLEADPPMRLESLIESLVVFFSSTTYIKEKVKMIESRLATEQDMNRQKWNALMLQLAQGSADRHVEEQIASTLTTLVLTFQNEVEYNFI